MRLASRAGERDFANALQSALEHERATFRAALQQQHAELRLRHEREAQPSNFATVAPTNKCLANINKSRAGGVATKKRGSDRLRRAGRLRTGAGMLGHARRTPDCLRREKNEQS